MKQYYVQYLKAEKVNAESMLETMLADRYTNVEIGQDYTHEDRRIAETRNLIAEIAKKLQSIESIED